MSNVELFTIGHSNLSLERFLDLLQRHEIKALVDIRRFPSSRAFPQFNRSSLSTQLGEDGIEYHWIEALGGRRNKSSNAPSVNAGLRNQSFRNYADYMLTDDFLRGFDQLLEVERSKRTVIMCAESVFWRCHRRLVSDFASANGGSVQHIFPSGEAEPHRLTPGAKVRDAKVTYPGQKMLFE